MIFETQGIRDTLYEAHQKETLQLSLSAQYENSAMEASPSLRTLTHHPPQLPHHTSWMLYINGQTGESGETSM